MPLPENTRFFCEILWKLKLMSDKEFHKVRVAYVCGDIERFWIYRRKVRMLADKHEHAVCWAHILWRLKVIKLVGYRAFVLGLK